MRDLHSHQSSAHSQLNLVSPVLNVIKEEEAKETSWLSFLWGEAVKIPIL